MDAATTAVTRGGFNASGFVNLDCASGGSVFAWNDVVLWTSLLLYLFVGIYVVCEYYFVPALEIIGHRLQWSESIQGASLMAAGSSFPEFLTALFGVLFFSKENPGPATNIGSAVFNICVIVSFSIMFLPSIDSKAYFLNTVAFSRDCAFFLIAAIESYVFFEVISPGYLVWAETLCMTLTWLVYIVSLFVTDRCVKFKDTGDNARDTFDKSSSNGSGFNIGPQLATDSKSSQRIERKNQRLSPMEVETAALITKQSPVKYLKSCLENTLCILEWPYKTIFCLTIPSVRVPSVSKVRASKPDSNQVSHASNFSDESDDEEARTTSMHIVSDTSTVQHEESQRMPRPMACTVLTFFLGMTWLGVITFFAVDIAEDVSACMGFGPSVTGLTVLAVGTSLPDCLSSIIVARRGKINMSISNALGSNVFDLGFCVGFPFLLKSLITGEAVSVGTSEDFLFLIAAVLLLAVVLIGLLLMSGMRVNKNQAFGLQAFYVVFLVVYCIWFGDAQDR